MKISTKGRYALRLMLDLALNDSEKPTRIKEISSRQGISDKYLEQIIAILNKARDNLCSVPFTMPSVIAVICVAAYSAATLSLLSRYPQ